MFGPDGKPAGGWIDWSERTRSSTESTIHCDEEAILLTGAASAVVSAVQDGPWFGLAITAMVVGLLLFFPRFTLGWARLGNGRFPGS